MMCVTAFSPSAKDNRRTIIKKRILGKDKKSGSVTQRDSATVFAERIRRIRGNCLKGLKAKERRIGSDVHSADNGRIHNSALNQLRCLYASDSTGRASRGEGQDWT